MGALIKTVLAGSLGAFLVLGCNSTDSGASVPVPGTWKGKAADSTLTMVFKDSTFEALLPNPGGTYNMSGTYTSTSSSIKLKYASSMQGAEGIPPPSLDTVVGTRSGSKMTIPVPYDYNGGMVTLTKQ